MVPYQQKAWQVSTINALNKKKLMLDQTGIKMILDQTGIIMKQLKLQYGRLLQRKYI